MVASGLVASLARSGGNTTGVSILSTELGGKRQELLIEPVPVARRMRRFLIRPRIRTRNFKKW
jgi:putative ABC transport system substrate-binding protein